jgi:hypothetical protein
MQAQHTCRKAAAGMTGYRPLEEPSAAPARTCITPPKNSDSQINKLKPSAASRLSPLRFGVLVAAICLWNGCAAEGPPHPPRIQRPVKINDLKVEQIGKALRLAFSRPLRTTDGRRLTSPIGVTIFRQLTPPGEHPSSPLLTAKPWVSLSAGELAALTKGNDIVYDDRLSAQDFRTSVGTTFSFMVVSFTRSFRGRRRESDPSNLARMQLLDVSPPVQGIMAVLTPHGIDLRWRPPAQSLTGTRPPAVAAYLVYRSTKPEPAFYVRLGQTVATNYTDRSFQFNETYFYRITAQFKEGKYEAETVRSKPVTIMPRDIFPPPVPRGLVAVYTGRSVQLIWSSVVAPDLAGYDIYREEPAGAWQRLNHELLRTPAFTDSTAKPRHQYSYWVTSVSLAHNESKPSVRVTIETR